MRLPGSTLAPRSGNAVGLLDQRAAAAAAATPTDFLRQRDLQHDGACLLRVDDDYMRSVVDYLELQLPKSQSIVRSSTNNKCPNFMITNWVRVPFEVDFGWGKPIFAGPGEAFVEGRSYLFADPENEGGLLLAIKLLKPHMERFEELIYHMLESSL